MFGLSIPSLQYWYKNILSQYLADIERKAWHPQKIETVNTKTGQKQEKPVYIFKKENIGANMSIDDKAIGNDGFTILSNHDTGKIAMMIESTSSQEVEQAMGLFGDKLESIKNISMDMSATYAKVCSKLISSATQVIDKFHVMKHVYEALGYVRIRIRKDIAATLSKGKNKTQQDKMKLSEIEMIRRINHAITQSPDKWSVEMTETVNKVFNKYNDLKKAYLICQDFKHWYDYRHHTKSINAITNTLYKWYHLASEIKEFDAVIKMIRKHEDEIINFFSTGLTSAKAERINGKIQRFVSNNYGIKDKDFIIYRIAGYFS